MAFTLNCVGSFPHKMRDIIGVVEHSGILYFGTGGLKLLKVQLDYKAKSLTVEDMLTFEEPITGLVLEEECVVVSTKQGKQRIRLVEAPPANKQEIQ